MKISCQGVTCTEKYLTVHVTVEEAAWMRFGAVRVPLSALLHEDVTDAMDRLVRRRLIEAWSETDIADPLF